jgi:hypothetical protein
MEGGQEGCTVRSGSHVRRRPISPVHESAVHQPYPPMYGTDGTENASYNRQECMYVRARETDPCICIRLIIASFSPVSPVQAISGRLTCCFASDRRRDRRWGAGSGAVTALFRLSCHGQEAGTDGTQPPTRRQRSSAYGQTVG